MKEVVTLISGSGDTVFVFLVKVILYLGMDEMVCGLFGVAFVW